MQQQQAKQEEWKAEWDILEYDAEFLLRKWMSPTVPEDFMWKTVLEAGCGGGCQTKVLARFAERVVAVDLNSVESARMRSGSFENVEFVQADIATMDLGEQFDFVISIGVLHHTDNPELAVLNLIKHTKTGGRLIFWVYSREGNWLVEHVVEPIRKAFLAKRSRKTVLNIAKVATILLYPIVHTVYRIPFLAFLPFYAYFGNFRKLSFSMNCLNVFDKLNAPQVQFISKERAESWLDERLFENVVVTDYLGVSWRISGTKT
jgi:SAM-dependent methyltransferase